ncbi:MAG: toll/interleukin-1 receptor domain-containing protein [Candidatus Accumulibacter sp.]|jgi:hypothetical protein|nr:toll/interleukin-1 receptor domain-containing protein [Candidatus Accumulibacter necessarius]
MADIFLSYATEDREKAVQVASQFESIGFSVWWDRKIPAGMTWRQVIETSLNQMGCMVVLWSEHSIASSWVSEEAEEGRNRARLVPALIDPVMPPLGFRGIQAADLIDWTGSPDEPGFRHLVAGVEALVGRRSGVGRAADSATSTARAGNRSRRKRLLAGSGLAVLLAMAAWVWHGQRSDTGEASQPRTVNVGPSPTSPGPSPALTPIDPVAAPTAAAAPPAEAAIEKPSPAKELPPKPRTTAVATAGTTTVAKPARSEAQPGVRTARPARCRDILERQGLGDALTAEDRAFFQKECRP